MINDTLRMNCGRGMCEYRGAGFEAASHSTIALADFFLCGSDAVLKEQT